MHFDTEKMTDSQKEKVYAYLLRERRRIMNDAFQEAMDKEDVPAAIEALISLRMLRDPDTGTLVLPAEQRRSMDLDHVIAQAMLIHVIHTIKTTD